MIYSQKKCIRVVGCIKVLLTLHQQEHPMKTLPSEPIPCMSNLYKLTTKCVTEVAIIGRKRVYWRTILVQKRGSKEYKAKLCSILA